MRDVYIDEWLFGALISLIMNYLLLWATERILNKNRKKQGRWRLLTAAFFGSIYYFLLCYRLEIGTVGDYELVVFIGVGLLMLVMAFPPRSVQDFLRTIGLFTLLLILTSGITYFLLYSPFLPHLAPYNPWQVVLVNVLSLLIVTELGWGLVHQVLLEKECLFSLRLSVNGNTREFAALLDTGNLLVDPLTKRPVLVVESQVLQGVVPPEILALSKLMAEGGSRTTRRWRLAPSGWPASGLSVIPAWGSKRVFCWASVRMKYVYWARNRKDCRRWSLVFISLPNWVVPVITKRSCLLRS